MWLIKTNTKKDSKQRIPFLKKKDFRIPPAMGISPKPNRHPIGNNGFHKLSCIPEVEGVQAFPPAFFLQTKENMDLDNELVKCQCNERETMNLIEQNIATIKTMFIRCNDLTSRMKDF